MLDQAATTRRVYGVPVTSSTVFRGYVRFYRGLAQGLDEGDADPGLLASQQL